MLNPSTVPNTFAFCTIQSFNRKLDNFICNQNSKVNLIIILNPSTGEPDHHGDLDVGARIQLQSNDWNRKIRFGGKYHLKPIDNF